MLHLLLRAERPFLIGGALAVAALSGWSCFAYSALSWREQVSTLRAEREEAFAKYQRLEQTVGELTQVEAKLAATRVEYSRAVQGWAETRSRIGMAQQELASLGKRLDQASDRASQTGSIRQPGPSKESARKP